jgi:polysaccharide export outer membrane protein
VPQLYLLAALLFALTACTGGGSELPPASLAAQQELPDYLIGPGDTLSISVFDNLTISDTPTVRPDGKITVTLIGDIPVAEKTTNQVAEAIEERLRTFVQDPLVTVIVTGFVGTFGQQVRVVGAATEPRAILHRANMSALDVMIEVGGLTEFAAGNRTVLVRAEDGESKQYRVRLDDLIKDGDISANVLMQPGDVLIIPESFF